MHWYGWWTVTLRVKVAWRCSMLASGEQYAMTTGVKSMPISSARSSGLHGLSLLLVFPRLGKEVDE